MKKGFCVCFVTVPDEKTAEKISCVLLEKKVAACVNIIGGVKSFFWWQGKIDNATELLLIIKSKKEVFKKIVSIVESLHPYEVPEVVSFDLDRGNLAYLKWLDANIRTSC